MRMVIFMSNNVLEYKGYYTKIQYSAEDHVLFGRIEGIKDLVNFECDCLDNVEEEFHSAVDDYLALCKDLGEDPDKPYKGIFNVRITPDLHRQAAIAADKNGETLNSFVAKAIREALIEKQQTIIVMPVPDRTDKDYYLNSSPFLTRSQISYGN